MMCPLCGVDVIPGKVCLNCGYDSSRPGASPSDRPSIPNENKQDNDYSARDVGDAVTQRKAAKPKSKEKAAAPQSAPIQVPDDYLEQIAQLDTWPTAAPLSSPTPAAPAVPLRSKAPQAAVPVTTQSAFENQRIVGYAGLVTSTVAVRIGEPDDLLPEGQDLQSLGAGPIGMRLRKAVDQAIADLKAEVLERGGNGVVGAHLDVRPTQGPIAFVTLTGTAVVLK